MANKGYNIDFNGVFDLEKQLKDLGDEALKKATVNALKATKDYVNSEIEKAMNSSPYNFNGEGYSNSRSKKSLNKVKKMEVKPKGMEAIAFAGVRFHDAKELWFTAHGGGGNPHSKIKDQNLYNAVRVKGPIKKEVEKIQENEFTKVIREALNG